LTVVEKWKMREHHTFFMYYAYFIFSKFEAVLPLGSKMLKAMKILMHALHTTKGFYDEVNTLVVIHAYYLGTSLYIYKIIM
jgi:hypothetical protein